MPKDKQQPRAKGELLGKDEGLRASTLAAMPGPIVAREHAEHPHVSINGTVYEWEPGAEDGVPPEALAVWRAYLKANE